MRHHTQPAATDHQFPQLQRRQRLEPLPPLHALPRPFARPLLSQLPLAHTPAPLLRADGRILLLELQPRPALLLRAAARPDDLPPRAVRCRRRGRPGHASPAEADAAAPVDLRGQRLHLLQHGHPRGRHHPHERPLARRGKRPRKGREEPRRSRTAQPAQPTQPPLPAQHAEQYLRPHRLRHGQGAASRARPEPPAPARALRKSHGARPAVKRSRLYPKLHRLDANPPGPPRRTPHRLPHSPREQHAGRPAAAHFPHRKRLQARRQLRQAQLHPHPHRGKRRERGGPLPHREQQFPQTPERQERIGHRARTGAQPPRTALPGAIHLDLRHQPGKHSRKKP